MVPRSNGNDGEIAGGRARLRARKSSVRRATFLGGLGGLFFIIGCRDPTQIKLSLYTDVPYEPSRAVAIFTDDRPDKSQAAAISRESWDSSGFVGTLVLVPSGKKNATIGLQVVLGITRHPQECDVNAPNGCVISRRLLSFIEHASLELPISLHAVCIGKACKEDETCNALGRCVPATIDPEGCRKPGGCLVPDDTIPSGTRSPTDAGTGDTEITELEAGTDSSAGTHPAPGPVPSICKPVIPLVDTSAPTKIVGQGNAASCTEDALRKAVADGGTIAFRCGPAPLTLSLSSTLRVTKNTVLDGGGLITLSGNGRTGILSLDTRDFEAKQPRLTIQRLSLHKGLAGGDVAGSDTNGSGAAIYLNGGSLHVVDSIFADNQGPREGTDVSGGAIFAASVGDVIIQGSRFVGNKSANGGAIGVVGGALTLVNSQINDNEATGRGGGEPGNTGGNGGGIYMLGQGNSLSICGCTISNNTGGAFGGGICRIATESEDAIIDRTTIDGNSVPDHPDKNLPSGGGGLYLQGITADITSSTISNNTASNFAGLWVLGQNSTKGYVNLTNVTIAGNQTWPQSDLTKQGIGGGVTIDKNMGGTIVNCTIVGNKAQFASGIAGASVVTIRNTIIANTASNEWTPLNCTGTDYASPSATGDHNIQWPLGTKDDMDCANGIVRGDPKMGALGDHGGPTKTVEPLPGSPVLGKGKDCPSTDQRGLARKSACTLGAFEVQ